MEEKQVEQWAIIELFGHQRIAGLMSECSIGGCSFVRVDVPGYPGNPGYTKLYGNGAIYAITLTDEETGRAAAKSFSPKPMNRWSAREMLGLPGPERESSMETEEEDF